MNDIRKKNLCLDQAAKARKETKTWAVIVPHKHSEECQA